VIYQQCTRCLEWVVVGLKRMSLCIIYMFHYTKNPGNFFLKKKKS